MNALITSLRNAFDNLLTQFSQAVNDTYARANAERVEMLDLLGRMTETRAAAAELNSVCIEYGTELLELGTDARDLAEKIDDAMNDPNGLCPSVPYEDLVGFCSRCGAEITFDDNYDYEHDKVDDEFICGECVAIAEAEAEA